MVEMSLEDGVLRLTLLGWSRWLAFAAALDIPLSCIAGARPGPPGLPAFRWGDRRILGTGVPGRVAAGSYRLGSPPRAAFLDLRRSSQEVVELKLRDYRYDLVMVEVGDAAAALRLIERTKAS